MRMCYVDESGCTGTLPGLTSQIQPVFVIAGVAIPQHNLANLTHDFLSWKAKFFPRLSSTYRYRFDLLLTETKGSEVRKSVLSSSRREKRHAIGLLDHFLLLLEDHRARIMGRVWVKCPGAVVKSTSIYTWSMQSICTTFQNLLEREDAVGLVVADSRTKGQNAKVSHSIFTQKFKSSGDQYNRILEMPTFGHSENHVGIQIADLLCSALLFPMAVHAYCHGTVQNVHVHDGYGVLRERFGLRLKQLQHRYSDGLISRGGLIVSDGLGQKSGGFLFRPPVLATITPGVRLSVPKPTILAVPPSPVAQVPPPQI